MGRFVIIDFPTQADKFLSPEEQEFVIDRLNNDRGDAEADEITLSKILHHLSDWRLYFWAFNLFASTLPGYAYSYFLPIILKNGMGFSTTQSQLLSAPPYVLAAILCYVSGWIGDRYEIRGPIIIIHQLLTAVGMVLTAFGQSNAVRYFGAYLGKSLYYQASILHDIWTSFSLLYLTLPSFHLTLIVSLTCIFLSTSGLQFN